MELHSLIYQNYGKPELRRKPKFGDDHSAHDAASEGSNFFEVADRKGMECLMFANTSSTPQWCTWTPRSLLEGSRGTCFSVTLFVP